MTLTVFLVFKMPHVITWVLVQFRHGGASSRAWSSKTCLQKPVAKLKEFQVVFVSERFRTHVRVVFIAAWSKLLLSAAWRHKVSPYPTGNLIRTHHSNSSAGEVREPWRGLWQQPLDCRHY